MEVHLESGFVGEIISGGKKHRRWPNAVTDTLMCLIVHWKVLKVQKQKLEKKIERERIILGDLPELSVSILELARERGRITIADAAKTTRASRNTIKDHVKALTGAGHLSRHGAGRGTWYSIS